MTISNARRAGFALMMAAVLAAGLSTGTRLYYMIFFTMLAMPALGLVSAAWTLFSLNVRLRGVPAHARRGERLMAVFTLRHLCPLPVSAVSLLLNVPSGDRKSVV